MMIVETETARADAIMHDLVSTYRHDDGPTRVSFRDICGSWEWARRSDAYTHFLHRYPAKMLPYIPIFFLTTSMASCDDIVLDPFAGTGTVGLESICHPRPRNSKLIDMNPLARLIASAKITPLEGDSLSALSQCLYESIEKYSTRPKAPDFPNIDFWFRPAAIRDLAIIRDCIENLDCGVPHKDFFWVCFSSIIRDMSRADPDVAPPVRLSAKKISRARAKDPNLIVQRKRRFKALTLYRKAVRRNINRMQQLWDRVEAVAVGKSAHVAGADARNLTESSYMGKGGLDQDNSIQIPDGSIGLVISSPPYVNAQKYARTTKFELWWLELIEVSSHGLSSFDAKLIGTERIPYSDYSNLSLVGIQMADEHLQRIYDQDPRRAGIASRFLSDMTKSIAEIRRVLKPGGYCVLVLGNNVISNVEFPNHRILGAIAEQLGLRTEVVLVDEIRSRGLFTKRHPTAGVIADEYILVLKKPSGSSP